MRILTWNLNHRAARRRIPGWVTAAAMESCPDVIVFTEYVVGPDHQQFVASLDAGGLGCVSVTDRPGRENQLLIATREAHTRASLADPGIHVSLPSNTLEVRLDDSGVVVLGFRMPAYSGRDVECKRRTWDWLLEEASRLVSGPAIITGDFNTAFGDSVARCGDCIEELASDGWQSDAPAGGVSWRHPRTGTGRSIDHLFASPGMRLGGSTYSWEFEHVEGASPGAVGLPDHALLIARVDPREHVTSDDGSIEPKATG